MRPRHWTGETLTALAMREKILAKVRSGKGLYAEPDDLELLYARSPFEPVSATEATCSTQGEAQKAEPEGRVGGNARNEREGCEGASLPREAQGGSGDSASLAKDGKPRTMHPSR